MIFIKKRQGVGVLSGVIRGFEGINLAKKRKTFDKRAKSVYTDLAKSVGDGKRTPVRATKKVIIYAPLVQLDRALVYGTKG